MDHMSYEDSEKIINMILVNKNISLFTDEQLNYIDSFRLLYEKEPYIVNHIIYYPFNIDIIAKYLETDDSDVAGILYSSFTITDEQKIFLKMKWNF